jgi:hypothetical protein
MRTVGNLALCLKEWEITKVKVDSTGIGWGVAGRLAELRGSAHNAEVIRINFGENATPGNQDKFLNKRAEIWWNGRELARSGQWDLTAVSDDTLHELSTPLYEVLDSRGRIKIEDKKKVIQRLGGVSPDSAEALLLSFWNVTTEMVLPKASNLGQSLWGSRLTQGRRLY